MSETAAVEVGTKIKSLDKGTVHRICSGQVIISLANAIKELVENSMDAGAKSIEIRLKNFGSESIEVIDDGPGIEEQDFQTITLKHYTSKIECFEDLESLATFGFRGEALSSLCALAQLSITTRHASSTCAYRLEYDRNGVLVAKTKCARSPGTTVCLERLFHTLPVRHKEFMRNLKKEFAKAMHVLQCYCLASEGVRLSCWNFVAAADKGTKMMSTHSKNSLRENIIEIFGVSVMQSLVRFEQCEPSDEHLAEFKVKPIRKPPKDEKEKEESNKEPNLSDNDENEDPTVKGPREAKGSTTVTFNYSSMFTIDGYISTCTHNAGRSAPDRQYLYVNKRPCEHAKLAKLVNEQFHQFNRNQYPMFVLNINTHTENVDVNVTPDKLQMFIRHEAALMAIIKSSLIKMYSRLYTTVNLNDTSINAPSPKSQAIMASFLVKPTPSQQQQQQQQPQQQPANNNLLTAANSSVSPPQVNNKLPELKIVDTRRRPIPEPSPEQVRQVLNILSPSGKNEQTARTKTPPPSGSKRDRANDDDDSAAELSPPSEFFRERVLKQPRLSIDETTGSPKIVSPPKRADAGGEARQSRRSSRSPTLLAVKPVYGSTIIDSSNSSSCGSEVSASPFSLSEKKSMFQNRIGSPTSLSSSSSSSSMLTSGRELMPIASSSMISSTSSMMNSSFADRIDLHMCNRRTGVVDSPEVHRTRRVLDLTTDEFDENKEKEVRPRSKKTTTHDHHEDDEEAAAAQETTLIEQPPMAAAAANKSKCERSVTTPNEAVLPTQLAISNRKSRVIKSDMNELKRRHAEMIRRKQELAKLSQDSGDLIKSLKFKSRNMESKEAEIELDRSLTKADFARMKIIGQFNKGFIVTQLNEDLFIVDQHAADEIYNFETLQTSEGRLERQQLLQPRYLDLPVSAESLLVDNLGVLTKLGYDVQVCSNRKCGNRIMLTAVPMSRQSNKILNMNDIDELVFVLSETGGSGSGSGGGGSLESFGVKSSSLRKLYASKACRKSVMIGDALNANEMRRIVTHLSEIDKPWNCPHGRPTMRHLVNLELLRTNHFGC